MFLLNVLHQGDLLLFDLDCFAFFEIFKATIILSCGLILMTLLMADGFEKLIGFIYFVVGGYSIKRLGEGILQRIFRPGFDPRDRNSKGFLE